MAASRGRAAAAVLALRHLGTARTGAYFSAAPFVGAAVSLPMFADLPGPLFWMAAVLMGAGIGPHLTETHEHTPAHMPIDHVHEHTHDSHHQHEYDSPVSAGTAHTHAHRHEVLVHALPHFPDIHHRHEH